MKNRYLISAALLAVTATVASAAFSGAIMTTTEDGIPTNANIYESREAVYLSGGGGAQHAGSLEDGVYYFQVTDPSGRVLLSTDDVECRMVVVKNGVIAGVPADQPVAACSYHQVGAVDPDTGAQPVALAPFLATPNPGGEYKVTMASRSTFVGGDTKSDNFKVRAPTAAHITVCVFDDQDGNGVQEPGEPFLPHWPVSASGVDGGVAAAQTDDQGCVSFTYSGFDDGGSEQTIELTQDPRTAEGWTQTAPATGTITLTVRPGDDVHAPNFGNHKAAVLDPVLPVLVTVTATPAYTQTYNWTIRKTVDQDTIRTRPTAAARADYSVEVSHDSGVISDVVVTGRITVSNPNASVDIAGVDVTQAVDNGATCRVDGGRAITVAADSHVTLDYTCLYEGVVSLPASGMATAVVSGNSGAQGTAAIDFTQGTANLVNDEVAIGDDLAGSLGTVTVADPSPKLFTYDLAFAGDPEGTCTAHVNTATLHSADSEASDSAQATVLVCVGANLGVGATSAASLTPSIAKSADRRVVQTGAASTIVNYTVTVTESGWRAAGVVAVMNANDWIGADASVTVAAPGASCEATAGQVALAPGGSADVEYTCLFATVPASAAGLVTATVEWDAAALFSAAASASAGAAYAFPALEVIDVFDGTPAILGTLTAPVASRTFTYAKTLANAAPGLCRAYGNTATVAGLQASSTVTMCNTKTGALTMGFWQNKNGQAIITGGLVSGGVAQLTPWLRAFNPFQDLAATSNPSAVARYVTNVIKAANASGAAMNAMLKGQMLATALDVYFSGAGGEGNRIAAPAGDIGLVAIDLTQVNKTIGSSNYEDASSSFGSVPSRTVLALLSWAAGESDAGGSLWYGQRKNGPNSQELAKDTFDAINNAVAYIAP